MKSNYRISSIEQVHLPQCIQLWHDCFGDEESFIRFFLSKVPLQGWLICDHDKVVSQLFILHGSHPDFPNRPVQYIYACATHKMYRKQGLMAELLNQVKTEAQQIKAFVLIQPADNHLADYYKNCGFEPIYRYKQTVVKSFNSSLLQADNGTLEMMQQIRNIASNNHRIIWPTAHLEIAIQIAKEEHGDLLFFSKGKEQGYVLYRQINDLSIRIDEAVYPTDICLREVLDFVHQQTGCQSICLKTIDQQGSIGAMGMGIPNGCEIDWHLGLD